MARIEKKIWPEEFEEILGGKKKYELRLADFDVNEGDTLVFMEYDPWKKEYTGKNVEKRVTYVGKLRVDKLPYYSKEDIEEYGLQIISLE